MATARDHAKNFAPLAAVLDLEEALSRLTSRPHAINSAGDQQAKRARSRMFLHTGSTR